MEGGAMRGMFTAGVTDVFMENEIEFNGAIGVSAGAVFGCNYKSHQIGRAIRYNKAYCTDRRYASYRAWLRTGDLYSPKFDYEELPFKLDIFDTKTYIDNPMDFYVVSTDILTGEPVYTLCNKGDKEDILWMRASASMPVFSNPVEISGGLYLDGGMADSVPVKYFEKLGYDRNVLILTRPKGYRKSKYPCMGIIRRILKKYPELYKSMGNRHIMYNETMEYIEKCEALGKILVIRPPKNIDVKPVERSADKLEAAYQMGRSTGLLEVERVKNFLK